MTYEEATAKLEAMLAEYRAALTCEAPDHPRRFEYEKALDAAGLRVRRLLDARARPLGGD